MTSLRAKQNDDDDVVDDDDTNAPSSSNMLDGNTITVDARRSISTKWDERWFEGYDRLVEYWKKHNSTIVPIEYEDDPALGNWVARQRFLFNKNDSRMTPERIERLEAIGFVWDAQEAAWQKMYNRFVAFKKNYNSTIVPTRIEDDPELGSWVHDQRSYYKRNDSRMTPERIERLEAIGFIWDAQEAAWQEMYCRLVEYKQEQEDVNVPRIYDDDPRLGLWASTQRSSYKKGKLSSDRIDRLEAIGFVWDAKEAAWQEMYNRLVEYKDKKGDADVPQSYDEDPKLSKWVSTQRRTYKKGKLSSDRIEKLESIGFKWRLKGKGKTESIS